MKCLAIVSLLVFSVAVCIYAEDGVNPIATDTNITTTTITTTTAKPTTTTTSEKPTTTTSEKPTTTPAQPTTTPAKPTTTPAKPTTTSAKPTTTSAKPATSGKPTTSKPTPKPPVYAYQDPETNVTCLMMQATMSVSFKYDHGTKNMTSAVPRADDLLITGTCGNDTDSILLSWKVNRTGIKDELLEFKFTKSGDNYQLSRVMFSYTGSESNSSESKFNNFTTGVGKSYNCTQGVDLMLGTVKVSMKDIRVQAFMDKKETSPDFDATGTDCYAPPSPPKKKTDAIVPIAVGAALAAMVVIVLIGYCIGRRRTMAGYQAMN